MPGKSKKSRSSRSFRKTRRSSSRKSSRSSFGRSSKSTSPFASLFTAACKRGTPCWTAICTIAKNRKSTPTSVCNSLHKAGLINRQKFNGQWICWPSFSSKTSSKSAKTCQTTMWQNFIDWCICSGTCTPRQINLCCGNQNSFMKNCSKFFSKQLGGSAFGSSSKSFGRSSFGSPSFNGFSYSFKTGSRKYRKVA
jgi:hypothetical protein